MAGSALPTHTGLAPQCGHLAQAAATAAAAAAQPGADPGAGCPAAPRLACAQAQLRPDSQVLQAGAIQPWPLNASGGGGAGPLEWLPPAGAAAVGRPAKTQLSLEGGAAPAFAWGPAFPPAMRTGGSFGMQFALDKPALLIYAGGVRWDGAVHQRGRRLMGVLGSERGAPVPGSMCGLPIEICSSRRSAS